jgi:hypothetical protein
MVYLVYQFTPGGTMDLPRRITVKTTEELHKAVRVKAAELGRPISEIVRGLLELWIEGAIEVPEGRGIAEE